MRLSRPPGLGFSATQTHQDNDFPTLLTLTGFSSCLDIIATNFPCENIAIEHLPPLGNSDHSSLLGKFDGPRLTLVESQPATRPAWVWSWEPERLAALKEDLARSQRLPSKADCEVLSCDHLWDFWRKHLLQKAYLYCTRLVSSKCSATRHSKPWMANELYEAIKAKHKSFRLHLARKTLATWTAFCKQRNWVSLQLRSAESNFVSSATNAEPSESSMSHPNLYKLMKALKKPPQQNIPDLTDDTSTATTDQAKSEMLNTFFISQSK